jgi:hypothetical protein
LPAACAALRVIAHALSAERIGYLIEISRCKAAAYVG